MSTKRPQLWEGCAQGSPTPREIPDRPSNEISDEEAVAVCFDKQRLARFLGISVRSLDRANAAGLLPCPDLVVGRSARWSPETIMRWLRSQPRLPSRGKRGEA
jgi:hypothetical protein